MIRRLGGMLLCMMLAGAAEAQSRKPRLPPGLDPGGIAVAVLGTGIDYTRPDLATHLARDGEGDLVGWDFVTGDNRPYAASPNDAPANWGGDGTELARRLASVGNLRLIPIRIDPVRPETLAQAIAFAARTPARILLVPMRSDQPDQWQAFRQAASRYPQIMIVATDGGQEWRYPASFDLENMLVIGAGTAKHTDLAFDGTPTPPPIGEPSELIARIMHSLRACAAAVAGGAVLANRRLMRLIGPDGIFAAPRSQAQPTGNPQCDIRILRP